MEMKEQACRVTGLGCPSVHDANAIWESQVVQGTVEAVGGAVQTGLGLMAWGSPEPLSKTAATIAIARGLDHMGAGWRSAWARKPVSALSDAVLEGAFGGYGTLVGVGVDLWSGGRSAWTTAEAPVPPPSVPPARPGATITLSYESGWNVRDFERKAEALQDLAERGKLRKAPNPVPRDPAVAAGFKNRLIRQAYAKYGKSDVARFQSLKKRILGMHADHVHELQLLGADDAANFTLLDGDVNMGIGRQIRAQIKGLDDYTPIIKVDVRGP